MIFTQAQQDKAVAAVKALLEADIKKYVPGFFQSDIPSGATQQLAASAAKAVFDSLK